ncbi:MAG: calcium-translocating P-type ATPase, PMCA-type [Clostridiales bacterium]|nr:calcium-translocating P-type ATPase, PMCA-type [Clostridiales bacterium]
MNHLKKNEQTEEKLYSYNDYSYYLKDTEEVCKKLDSGLNGISQNEAELRLERSGKNKLEEAKKDSILKKFLNQLADPMIIVLLVAAAISAAVAIVSQESFVDVFVILFVVVLNAVLGVIQESKAEKALEALKEMTAPESKVIRDGKHMHIKTEDIVVGDVIVLEAGDAVPADARILENVSLRAEEAALTGESVPVNKTDQALTADEAASLGDRKNMVYMGSAIVYGRGRAVVTATGMDTEMGKIASALTSAKEESTPLQVKLNQLSKVLTYLVLGICAVMFAYNLIRTRDFSTQSILNTFILAVSLAVAAIPEGLAAVVTITLSIGVTKMSKRNAVIRKLTAVETLGCTQIICSDKTGTLTQNKMTVVKSYAHDENLLATCMALCNDAYLDDANNAVGEPTECALVNYAYKLGVVKHLAEQEQARVAEAPFDSMRKMMSTIHAYNGQFIQYTKGAPDEILNACTKYLTKDGEVKELTEKAKLEILEENSNMAEQALRVLGGSYKIYDKKPSSVEPGDIENELIFLGLYGMIDPVRPEVQEAIQKCSDAGIRAIMITGDHKDTAVAIAKELGLLYEGTEAITGVELSQISDEELQRDIEKYSVYARVQPEHKVRIVKAWKAKGMITAMTGDGVNDAPSIKIADIGVGMGITGTDVTKNVADMILADDNFATIVSAVEEGRKIYANIKKSVQFLLSSNLSEIISIFIATVIGFTILKPTHILWINLVTDSLPALALGMEDSEPDIMKQKPRPAKENLFAHGMGIDIIYQGLLVAILTLAAFLIGHYIEAGVWRYENSADGMTMAFLTMSMAEIFHSFNVRSNKSIFKLKKQNFYLFGAMLIAMLLTVMVIYVPFFANIFDFTPISAVEYFIAMGLAFSIIPLVEIVKLAKNIYYKAKEKKALKA